ncbi:Acyl-CoA N-acyltransferase [Gracilaria domingensis]|nr:Acyl-CoA N-acyltransferase [Gracilaria domingensis]
MCAVRRSQAPTPNIETTVTSRHFCNGNAFKFRRYFHASDRDDVKQICANVYNSQDYVPRLLPAYDSDIQCEPFVLEGSTGVAAFIVVRHKHPLIDQETPSYREVFIEALRVREDLSGVGLATTILLEATKVVRRAHGEVPDLRILSTTIPENKAMTRVFHKAGWTAVSNMTVWPKRGEGGYLQSTGNSMLESLEVVHKISSEAVILASRWQRISEADDIVALVKQLRRNRPRLLRPGYFVAEGIHRTSPFLANEHAKGEERSAWRLDSHGRTVGLLFMRPLVLQQSSNVPPNVVSACVDDLDVAESAVWFVGNFLKRTNFRVSFDDGMNAEKMKNSPLLSSVKSVQFVVYEHLT